MQKPEPNLANPVFELELFLLTETFTDQCFIWCTLVIFIFCFIFKKSVTCSAIQQHTVWKAWYGLKLEGWMNYITSDGETITLLQDLNCISNFQWQTIWHSSSKTGNNCKKWHRIYGDNHVSNGQLHCFLLHVTDQEKWTWAGNTHW